MNFMLFMNDYKVQLQYITSYISNFKVFLKFIQLHTLLQHRCCTILSNKTCLFTINTKNSPQIYSSSTG